MAHQMTLAERYQKEVTIYGEFADEIRASTTWTDTCLMHGNQCDSSFHAQAKMDFVLKAQEAFIEKHRDEIKELAISMIKQELGEFKALLSKI